MNNREASQKTGIAESTVRKYAAILNIKYYGEGRHKVYDWQEADLPLLRQAIGKRGRPAKTRQ
jgi:hypothetical protein